MIKRKSRYDVIDFLSDKEWKIADLGSGTRGSCPHANVYFFFLSYHLPYRIIGQGRPF